MTDLLFDQSSKYEYKIPLYKGLTIASIILFLIFCILYVLALVYDWDFSYIYLIILLTFVILAIGFGFAFNKWRVCPGIVYGVKGIPEKFEYCAF